MKDAGLVSRGVALAIDLALIAIGTASTLSLLQFASKLVLVHSGLIRLVIDTLGGALPFLVGLIYTVGCWTLIGQTPGKWLMGLRVVEMSGQRVRFTRAVVRYLAYGVSAAPLGLGFLWVLHDPRRHTWHDKLSRTRVVYAKRRETRELRVQTLAPRRI